MRNLKTETIEDLKQNGKTLKDVLWCGNEDFGWFTIEDFLELANKYYDNGYGGAEVIKDLYIVGEDFWLERHEYDGSEWWEYKTMPKKPDNYNKTKVVFRGDYDDTLVEANKAYAKLELN